MFFDIYSFLLHLSFPTFDKILWSQSISLTKMKTCVSTSCTIRHISLVPWCIGLDRFQCTCIYIIPISKDGIVFTHKIVLNMYGF